MTDPDEVAAVAAGSPRPLLVATDVDGTLSPIVARAGDARLAPGAREALARLKGVEGVIVVVVSGRPLGDLVGQFGFDGSTRLLGSHGLEDSGGPAPSLDGDERRRLDEV